MDPWPFGDLPSPFPSDAFDPVGADVPVRLGGSGDLAAALPVLVGFRPRESVVLVALGGESGRRLGLTARVDIPRPEDARDLAGTLARRLAAERPEAALLAVVSEAPDVPGSGEPDRDLPHRDLVHEFVLALDGHGIPLDEALLVRSGRWWSYDCAEVCCLPGVGAPVPTGPTPLETASVLAGKVVARDREELELRIARTDPTTAAATTATVTAVGEEIADLVLRDGRDVAADRYVSWIDDAVAQYRRGSGRPDDETLARVGWGLRDVRVRDLALGFALGAHAAAAEALWTECTRRLPEPLDAAPATLLAASVWLRGDGAMARIALDRALDSDPDHALARLLLGSLEAGMGPDDLRALITAAQESLVRPPTPRDLDQLVDQLLSVARDETAAAARQVRAARAGATPRPGRARRGKRSPSRTRRPRSPE